MDDRQAVITSLGLILGVFLAYLQIQKNARASLRLQETHLRNALKLKLYERIGQVMADASDRLSKASTQYYSVVSSLSLKVRKQVPMSIHETGMDLANVAHDAQRQLNRVLNILEEYEIVFLRFASFRRQLSVEHARFLETHQAFWSAALPFLPFIHSASNQQVSSPILPSEQQLVELERKHDDYLRVCNDISGYMIDLQIETQNELLGDLFGREVPPRNPRDSSVRILRRDETELIHRPKGSLV